MKNIFIGIDNGVSGTIGIITENKTLFIKTPVFKCQDYTKKRKNISRVDSKALYELLEPFKNNSIALMERPMVNPTRFTATESALRCHEAMLSIIELLGISYQFIDSKEWQKVLLPHGTAKEDTKKLSLEIGNRLFPDFKDFKHPDRDGMLIAEYTRRMWRDK
jgi:hypothetical protein